MDFVSNQQPQLDEMLEVIGVKDVDQLFCAVPEKLKLPRPKEDDGLSEFEGISHMEALADQNLFPSFDNYLGGGSYEHYVPAIVSALTSKSDFLTAYTPYQAEASQGMLQTIFEFQSAICALTGMDVSNASVYDGASACAEALLMALRAKRGRKKILVARSLNPHYRAVIDQYLGSQDVDMVTVPFLEDGLIDQTFLSEQLDEHTAACLVGYPNFLGCVEDVSGFSSKVKEAGALLILSANPMAYGLFKSAGELGADIAVGDCQPFGIPLQFGGPYVGYIACKQELVRQIPGRLVGETVDTEGKRGFVLTLQAREQHIRREKATSNICTNQALAALASLIAMLWYGKKGVKELALTNYQRAAYLREQIGRQKGSAPVFNEFMIQLDQPIEHVLEHFRAHKIEPGIPLERYYPEMKNTLLVTVTETKDQVQLDRFADVMNQKDSHGKNDFRKIPKSATCL